MHDAMRTSSLNASCYCKSCKCTLLCYIIPKHLLCMMCRSIVEYNYSSKIFLLKLQT
uniref:Uncharacterized protein n=1 Tax=Arundo donax TaxID=35708 RepID=A0A0A9G6P5_ARUDO